MRKEYDEWRNVEELSIRLCHNKGGGMSVSLTLTCLLMHFIFEQTFWDILCDREAKYSTLPSGHEKTASTASAACRKWRSNQDLAENFGKVQQKKNNCNIFLFYYFKIGPLAFQSSTNSRRTTFSGAVGVHILKFIWQKILPEKKPACRQFEVFSSPARTLSFSHSLIHSLSTC